MLEKELVKIIKDLQKEVHLGDKRAEQFYNSMFSGNATPIFAGVGIGKVPGALLNVYKNANASNVVWVDNPNVGANVVVGLDATSDLVSLSVRSYGSGFVAYTHGGVTLTQSAEVWADTMSGTGPQALLIGIKTAKPIIFATNNVERVRIGGDGHLDIYDWNDAVMREVDFGADDSGGAGFKVLRVPN